MILMSVEELIIGCYMKEKKHECSHSNLEKEYISGMATGDYKCVDCGAVGWGKNWPENEQNRKEDK